MTKTSHQLKCSLLIVMLFVFAGRINAQSYDQLIRKLKTDQRAEDRLKTYSQLSSYYSNNSDSAAIWMDKAMKLIGEDKWPSFYTESVMDILRQYDRKADFPNMLKYANYFCNHYQQHKNTAYRNLAMKLRAYATGMSGDFNQSLTYFRELKGYLDQEKFRDEKHRADRLAQYYSSIGIVHAVNDKMTDALNYFLQGDSVLQYGGSTDVKQESKYCIGSIYSELGELEKSNEIFIALIQEYNRGKKFPAIFSVYDNLASNYLQLGDLDNARKYVKISIEEGTKNDDIDQLGYSYIELGNLSSVEGRHLEAKEAFQKSAMNFLKAKNTMMYNTARLMYAQNCNNSNTNLNEALSIFTELIAFFSEKNILQKTADSYRSRSTTLRKLKRYDEAFSDFEMYDSLNQEHIKSINDEITSELKTKYETDLHKRESEKQAKIAKQNLEIAQQNKNESQRKTTLLIVISGASILLLLILVLLLLFYRRLKQSEVLLIEQKNRIEQSEKEKSIMLKELHHRVKNNLQIVSSLLNLQKENVKDEVAKGAFNEGQNRVEAMAMIHRYLYSSDELTGIEMRKYFKQLVKSIAYSYGYDNDNIEIEFDITEATIDVDIAIPLGLVANELVSNVFKHAIHDVQHPKLYVGLHSDKELVFEIKDNGAGIPSGFTQNHSSSFGMSLIKSLAKQMKATLDYTYDNGSKIRLAIPKVSVLNKII